MKDTRFNARHAVLARLPHAQNTQFFFFPGRITPPRLPRMPDEQLPNVYRRPVRLFTFVTWSGLDSKRLQILLLSKFPPLLLPLGPGGRQTSRFESVELSQGFRQHLIRSQVDPPSVCLQALLPRAARFPSRRRPRSRAQQIHQQSQRRLSGQKYQQ